MSIRVLSNIHEKLNIQKQVSLVLLSRTCASYIPITYLTRVFMHRFICYLSNQNREYKIRLVTVVSYAEVLSQTAQNQVPLPK